MSLDNANNYLITRVLQLVSIIKNNLINKLNTIYKKVVSRKSIYLRRFFLFVLLVVEYVEFYLLCLLSNTSNFVCFVCYRTCRTRLLVCRTMLAY